MTENKEFSCTICGDAFDAGIDHFTCAAGHVACLPCFGDHVMHACEDASAGLDTVPLHCFIPNCTSGTVDDDVIKRLLQSEFLVGRDLLRKYLAAQISVALRSSIHGEVPITCAECGEYSEIHVKADKTYWESQQLKFDVFIETRTPKKIEQFRGEALREMKEEDLLELIKASDKGAAANAGLKGRLESLAHNANVLARLRTETQQEEAPSHIRTVTEKEVDDFFEKHKFDASLDEVAYKQLKSMFISTFGAEIAKARAKKRLEDLEPEIKAKVDEKLAEWRKNSINEFRQEAGLVSGSEFEMKNDDDEKKSSEEVLPTSSSLAVPANAQPRKKSIFQGIASVFRKTKPTALPDVAVTKVQRDQKNRAQGKELELPISSQFFICKKKDCTGAFCLRCEKFLHKSEAAAHLCEIDPEYELYVDVLRILVENATRKCPHCGFIGRKDYACTHITCDKCSKRFCYVCCTKLEDLAGGFGPHNQWTLATPQDSGRCPMYLQHKWGDRLTETGERYDGDPALALDRFHASLQKKAIVAKKASVDQALWVRMVERRFPKGIFPDGMAQDDEDPHVEAEENLT
eukprot:TRINITY_DN13926_c0_g1_i1.p1 TRINITY_DN13926_c0_g1~~TRINITY_DN13926_c0_g1_i1.p1  ORF type:complete len:576 (-),score=161.14 TRINITY_DN13926_c0_g1_i1:113-1840(-)